MMQGSADRPRRVPPINAPRDSVALLTIDVQNSQVLGLPARVRDAGLSVTADRYDHTVSRVTDNVRRLQDACRDAGIDLIHIRCASYTGDGSDGSRLFRIFGMPNDRAPHDTQFWPPVAPHADEVIVSKVSSGALNGSDLDHQLRVMGIRVLIVAGLVTSGCVENSIRGLADAGYQILLAEDACGDWTPRLHSVSCYLMGRWFATTAKTERIIERILEARSGDFSFGVENGALPPWLPAADDVAEDLTKIWHSSEAETKDEQTILLLVDMQPLTFARCDDRNDRVAGPGSSLDHPAIDACRTLLEAFRRAGRPVAHTRLSTSIASARVVPPLMRHLGLWAAESSADARYLSGFEPADGELVVPRTTFSLFTPWLADQLLRNLGVRRIIIAGIGLETCIASTARDACDRGYEVVLATDACLANEVLLVSATFEVLGLWYAKLSTTADLLERRAT